MESNHRSGEVVSQGNKKAQYAAGVAGIALLGYGLIAAGRRPRSPFPRDPEVDGTVSFLREGYTFIGRRAQRLQTDVFETRLMFQRVICGYGEDAARMFFVPGRFTRRGAIPLTTLTLLQDGRGVQMLDGTMHRERKQILMSVLTDADQVERLSAAFAAEWKAAARQWRRRNRVVLHDAVSELLTRAVCDWAGVPLHRADVRRRARAFREMVEGAGRVGPRNWRAQGLRHDSERWIERVIADVRRGSLKTRPGSALHVIAWHREGERLLSPPTAAVELINVLRPTVAIARFVTFAALALHDYPAQRAALTSGGDDYLRHFVHEVRRFYPFFPAIGGRVLTPFLWRGHQFRQGDWVLLDVYSTNHDERIWRRPDAFEPERFRNQAVNAFNFIPQGGGSPAETHRCAGEQITVRLIEAAVRELLELEYEVPSQDLSIKMNAMPALPTSGFVITNLRPR